MRGGTVRAGLMAAAWLGAACASGCAPETEMTSTATTEESVDRGALLPVSLPDLSRLEESVQEQVRRQHESLMRELEDPGTATVGLGSDYGAMGTSLMAAENFAAAEPYYLNAQALAPGDPRWPYYLGHLYKSMGALAESVASFERALELQPDDVATLVWLGEVHLAAGRPEAAERPLAKALTLRSGSVAARFALGRAALATEDYPAAVEHLEEALAMNGQAVSIHYPLALAYRGLGDTETAEAHLRQRGDFEILPRDPLMEELRESLQSVINYEIEGSRALDGGDAAAAIDHFLKGLELVPTSPSLRYKLGTALLVMGDGRAAMEQFERVVRVSPEHAEAHFSLGMLMETGGRGQEAIERFSAVVRYEPEHIEARVRLANLLRRNGRPQESLSHYEHVLEIDPRIPEAAAGYAMALVRLQRYQEARALLSDAVEVYGNQPEFAHALARLLAAAPDDRVRDGERALAVMLALPEDQRRVDLGETMAMTFAELGQYEEAVAWQRGAIVAARQAGREDLAQRMAESLRLYEARQPCRTPWRDEDLP